MIRARDLLICLLTTTLPSCYAASANISTFYYSVYVTKSFFYKDIYADFSSNLGNLVDPAFDLAMEKGVILFLRSEKRQ